MQKEQSISKSGLRFTKWSRKSYAVFLTIGREVTIGVLAVQLCLRLSTKIIQGLKNTILQLDDQDEEVGLEEVQFEFSGIYNWLFCFFGIDFSIFCTLDSYLLKAYSDKPIQLIAFFFRSLFSFFARFLKRHFLLRPSGNFSTTHKPKTKINEV
ncbi:MAG: hypothetical protein WD530_03005 [Vicingaceae bacterium]